MQYLFCLLLLMKVYSKSHGTHARKAATSSFQMERKLRVLLMKDSNISAVADGAFTQLEFLQKLDLGCNRTLWQLFMSKGLYQLNLMVGWIDSLIDVRSFGSMSTLRQLHLEDNHLVFLNNGVFSMLTSLEVLNLQGNQINKTQEGVFTPMISLALLNLAHNQMSTIYFKTFLSIHMYSTHILLEGNRWNCNRDLQKVFHKLRSVQRLFSDDHYNLSCNAPTELMVIVLIIMITVVITVLGAMVMSRATCLTQITRD
uniref:Uncharacterized protein n=1 Tax=Salmo trutta TaxID=8032 RepID=A0A674F2L4_SALTR